MLREQPYALVDLDWLGWVEPAPSSRFTQRSVLAENLRLIWPTFREAGVERLVLARYVEDRAQLDEFRAALPGVELCVVRLVASQAVIERRLRARDSGAQLAEHLAETAAFAARGEASALEDAVVDNGDRPLAGGRRRGAGCGRVERRRRAGLRAGPPGSMPRLLLVGSNFFSVGPNFLTCASTSSAGSNFFSAVSSFSSASGLSSVIAYSLASMVALLTVNGGIFFPPFTTRLTRDATRAACRR